MNLKNSFKYCLIILGLIFYNINLFSQAFSDEISNSNNLNSSITCPTVFEYLTNLGDYALLGTQKQLNKYGTIYDFAVMPDGSYIAIFGNSPSNLIKNRNSSITYIKPNFINRALENIELLLKGNIEPDNIILYKLDSDFNAIWSRKLYNLGNLDKLYLSWDISIENNLFSVVSSAIPSGNYDLKLVDLKTGNYISEYLDNTYQTFGLFIKILDARHILWAYPNQINDFRIRIYDINDFRYVENPPYLKPLLDYLSEGYKVIDSFFIDEETNFWILQVLKINKDQDWIPVDMQTLIYDPFEEKVIKLFNGEPFENLYSINIKFSDDKQSLILLANSSSYRYYLLRGVNNLVCKNYSIVKDSIISVSEPTQYWALGNSGHYFLKKDFGLYEAISN